MNYTSIVSVKNFIFITTGMLIGVTLNKQCTVQPQPNDVISLERTRNVIKDQQNKIKILKKQLYQQGKELNNQRILIKDLQSQNNQRKQFSKQKKEINKKQILIKNQRKKFNKPKKELINKSLSQGKEIDNTTDDLFDEFGSSDGFFYEAGFTDDVFDESGSLTEEAREMLLEGPIIIEY